MIQELVNQWECNKHKLEEYFKTINQEDYSYELIVKKIFELCLLKSDDDSGFNISKMTVIDDGNYEGTQIFIIPKDTYSPSIEDYVITHTYYGSCSGCDTLEKIRYLSDERQTNETIKEYMTVALHLVQKLKWLGQD